MSLFGDLEWREWVLFDAFGYSTFFQEKSYAWVRAGGRDVASFQDVGHLWAVSQKSNVFEQLSVQQGAGVASGEARAVFTLADPDQIVLLFKDYFLALLYLCEFGGQTLGGFLSSSPQSLGPLSLFGLLVHLLEFYFFRRVILLS